MKRFHKLMLPMTVLLCSVTACSNNTTSTPTSTGGDTSNYTAPTTSDALIDVMTTPTVVVAEESYRELKVVLYQNQSAQDLLLGSAPSAYDLIFTALSSLTEEDTPIEMIRSAVADSLGEQYDTVLAEGGDSIQAYDSSDNFGISAIHALVSSPTGTEGMEETQVTGELTSHSARLYLPIVGSSGDYYILTIQEIILDEEHSFTYIEQGTATISTFNQDMALDLLEQNIQTINRDYGFDLSIPTLATDSSEESEESVELDGVSSATPEYHIIETENATGQLVKVSVSHFPNKAVYLDYSAFDVAIALGIGGQYEQLHIRDDMPSLLETGVNNDINLSTYLAEQDYSLLEDFEPNVIFINKESAHLYDVLSEIAPVIVTDTGESSSFDQYLANLERMSVMYSVQYLIDGFAGDYASRLATLSSQTSGKTALIQVWKDGGFTAATTGYDWVFESLELDNLAENVAHSTDFSAVSPDYRFVLDYDGTMPEQDYPVIPLELSPWTQHSGGILAMDLMISDLEQGIS